MTSQNFFSKAGSFEILKVLTRWGFKSFFFQIWCTLCRDIPTSLAILRTLQRLFPRGGWVTRVMTCSIFSEGIEGFRPLPGASFKPSIPFSKKRLVHFETQTWLTPDFFTTSSCDFPSARSNTISARRLSRFDVVTLRTRRSSSTLSSSFNLIFIIGLLIRAG